MKKRMRGTFFLEDVCMTAAAWIHSILLFSGVYLAVASLLKMSDAEAVRYLLHSIWLLLPIASGWYFIRKIHGFAGYLAASIGVIAVTAIGSRCLLTTGFSVLIIIIRCTPRLTRGKMIEESPGDMVQIELWEIPTIFDQLRSIYWLFFVVYYIALIFLHEFQYLEWMFWIFLAEVLLTYLFSSFEDMKYFVLHNRRIANLPVGVMQRMQRAVLCITFLLLLIFILPSILYGEEPLKRLADIEMQGYQAELMMPEQEAAEVDGMAEMLAALAGEEIKELPEWLQTLLDLLFYLIGIAAAVLILVLMYHALRHMMQSFAQGQSQDEVILLDASGQEQYAKARAKNRQRGQMSINRKIRKEYKKTILKFSHTKPSGSETPRELEEHAGVTGEKQQIFHELYEKARYSAQICTGTDLEQLRSAQKEKHH